MTRSARSPRRALALAAATLVLLAGAASAAPAVSANTSGSTDAQTRGRQALASLDYPVRELGYAVEFRDYTGGTLGTANSRTKRIVVYVKRSQSHQSLRVTIAHELGHALDYEHATVERRRDYRTIRRLSPSARWYPCSGCSDYASHAGDWAEVFAYWLAGPGDFRSEVTGPPSEEQLRRLTPIFRLPRG